jgi:hypothetical protein
LKQQQDAKVCPDNSETNHAAGAMWLKFQKQIYEKYSLPVSFNEEIYLFHDALTCSRRVQSIRAKY